MHQLYHRSFQRTVEFDAGILFIRVLLGISICAVLRDSARYVLGNQSSDSVFVLPFSSEQVIKVLEDVLEVVEFRLGLAAGPGSGGGFDLGVLVGKLDILHRLLLDTVAVHVDGLENSL